MAILLQSSLEFLLKMLLYDILHAYVSKIVIFGYLFEFALIMHNHVQIQRGPQFAYIY